MDLVAVGGAARSGGGAPPIFQPVSAREDEVGPRAPPSTRAARRPSTSVSTFFRGSSVPEIEDEAPPAGVAPARPLRAGAPSPSSAGRKKSVSTPFGATRTRRRGLRIPPRPAPARSSPTRRGNAAARSTVRSQRGTKPTMVRAACHSGWVDGGQVVDDRDERDVAPRRPDGQRRQEARPPPTAAARPGSVVCSQTMPKRVPVRVEGQASRRQAAVPASGRGAKRPTSSPSRAGQAREIAAGVGADARALALEEPERRRRSSSPTQAIRGLTAALESLKSPVPCRIRRPSSRSKRSSRSHSPSSSSCPFAREELDREPLVAVRPARIAGKITRSRRDTLLRRASPGTAAWSAAAASPPMTFAPGRVLARPLSAQGGLRGGPGARPGRSRRLFLRRPQRSPSLPSSKSESRWRSR